jgi:hypothetical protein
MCVQHSSLGFNMAAIVSIPLRFLANTLELFLEVLEVLIGEPFKTNQFISSTLTARMISSSFKLKALESRFCVF